MTLGYVHFGGPMGDGVRVDAIRRFFDETGIKYSEFALTHQRNSVDIVREVLSLYGAKHLLRKLVFDRSHPILKELNWHIEARQWEKSIEQGVRLIGEHIGSIDLLLAETIFAGIVCLHLKETRNRPFVYDMHGITKEESKLSGSREWMTWCASWEKRVAQAADQVLVVSPRMAKYIEEVYDVQKHRIHVVSNGSYVTDREAKFDHPLRVIYAGNFAQYERVMEFVRTAKAAANTDCQFWLLGDGALRNEIFDYVNAKSVDLIYWGRKTRDIALDLCARAQVGFSGQSGCLDLQLDYPRQIGCPIKLFDYASCGLPIVAPPGEWAPLIEEADCGVIIKRLDTAAYVEALSELSDPVVWRRKSKNGKALIRDRYEWSKVLAPLAELCRCPT